jgi:hypothetical protein
MGKEQIPTHNPEAQMRALYSRTLRPIQKSLFLSTHLLPQFSFKKENSTFYLGTNASLLISLCNVEE